QDVLDGFLSKVVIDPVDLCLAEPSRQFRVERIGALDVIAERLLDDDPAPPLVLLEQTRISKTVADESEEVRRHREIEQIVRRNPMSFADLLQCLLHTLEQGRIVELTREVIEAIFDALPLLGIERLAFGLANLFAHVLAIRGLIDLRSRDADDGELRG